MFSNKAKPTNPVTISNIIGQGSHLEGNITTTGNLRIEGKITGSIKAEAKVVLSHTAEVEGNILAHNAEIGGSVKGMIEVVELLVLKSSATVWGDIIASKLVFEEGACFDGKCKMGKETKELDKEHNFFNSESLFFSENEKFEGDVADKEQPATPSNQSMIP